MPAAEEAQETPPLPIQKLLYRIIVGITHPQTSLTLTGHLRSLREEGFQVTLISGVIHSHSRD